MRSDFGKKYPKQKSKSPDSPFLIVATFIFVSLVPTDENTADQLLICPAVSQICNSVGLAKCSVAASDHTGLNHGSDPAVSSPLRADLHTNLRFRHNSRR